MSSFPINGLLFTASDILVSHLNPCMNSGGLVPKELKLLFWQPLKMEQDPPSCQLVDIISYLVYNIKRLQGKIATDTFYVVLESFHGNTCYHVYSHKVGFSDCYTNQNTRRDSTREKIDDFVHDLGVTEHLIFDGFQYQVTYKIIHHISAPL